jgi:Tol biopolymer transport system component
VSLPPRAPEALAATPAPVRAVATSGRTVEPLHLSGASDGPAFSPAFGSNGTAIFFHTGGNQDSRSAIEVATSDKWPGGDLGIMTIVDDGARNYHAQPSPDGRFVAFDSDREGERAVYVANRDGSHVRRVTGEGYAAAPTWSPDGERLAYIRAEAGRPRVWNLWMQPVAGSQATRLTNHRYGQTWTASWFPDGRRVAYTHDDKVIILDTETGESRQFSSPVKGRALRTPAVSPDGSTIIFQVARHGAWLLDLDDASMRCVLEDPDAEEFAWAPDGRRVAFHSRRDGRWGIYLLAPG